MLDQRSYHYLNENWPQKLYRKQSPIKNPKKCTAIGHRFALISGYVSKNLFDIKQIVVEQSTNHDLNENLTMEKKSRLRF